MIVRLRVVVTVWLAGLALLGLGLLEVCLVFWAERAAADFPEVAALAPPVLAFALAFCACGQVAMILAAVVLTAREAESAQSRRVVGSAAALVVVLLAMAGLLIALVVVTATANATPPALALLGWGGSALLLAAATTTLVTLLAELRQRGQPAITPAARAGSA